jgi:hypothetical protein
MTRHAAEGMKELQKEWRGIPLWNLDVWEQMAREKVV